MLKKNTYMRFIDTHCHLYLSEFKNDLQEVFKRAQATGVERFYLPGIDSSITNDLLSMQKEYPDKCFAMAGLHPCSVNDNYRNELKKIDELLNSKSFMAIGEIGLDLYWSDTFIQLQYEVFEIQMHWALQKNLPIVIHTRNAMQQTIDFVKPFATKGLKGVFHCFGGSYSEARQITDMNFFLGIGGVITYKKSGLDTVMKQIDLNHVVLETDAPYLAPVPFRGKRNESSYIIYIAEKLAEIKNVSLKEVAEITTANAEKFFGN